MNTLHCKPPFSVSGPRRPIAADIEFAESIAEEEAGMLEPALIAWTDRFDGSSSPPEQCCPTPDSWHDYGASHGGRVEVHAGRRSFIFTESSQFDSYEHFSPSPIISLRDKAGREWTCLRTVGDSPDPQVCVPTDSAEVGFG
jgi:hypothetical protein